MLQTFKYLKGLSFLFFICNFWMLNWVFQLLFDEFNCVFIDNGQDLQYKKLSWFLKCQKFIIFWGTITKISG